jgi:hypothetical protein
VKSAEHGANTTFKAISPFLTEATSATNKANSKRAKAITQITDVATKQRDRFFVPIEIHLPDLTVQLSTGRFGDGYHHISV